jgi:hypothetical protein
MEDQMAEVRVQLASNVLDQFQQKLGDVKPTQITLDAIALYNWAVNERAAGRIILSAESNGDHPKQITTPSLTNVKQVA